MNLLSEGEKGEEIKNEDKNDGSGSVRPDDSLGDEEDGG